MRMFVAIVPPQDVIEELDDFLSVREGMPWINPEQWHLTLAFYEQAPEHRVDELVERIGAACARRSPFQLRLAGAGVFPNPVRASVFWIGVDDPSHSLAPLAVNARGAGNVVGATPDGKPFVPHLTVARLRRPIEGTNWLRVLDTFSSAAWDVSGVELIASHLGEGPARRPRYSTIAQFGLGAPAAEGPETW